MKTPLPKSPPRFPHFHKIELLTTAQGAQASALGVSHFGSRLQPRGCREQVDRQTEKPRCNDLSTSARTSCGHRSPTQAVLSRRNRWPWAMRAPGVQSPALAGPGSPGARGTAQAPGELGLNAWVGWIWAVQGGAANPGPAETPGEPLAGQAQLGALSAELRVDRGPALRGSGCGSRAGDLLLVPVTCPYPWLPTIR